MDNLSEQFEQIYDQYIDKIYRFIFLKVDSQATTEDITSKVFIKGWEAFQRSQDEIKNPGAFLYQIARNAVVDHYRDRARVKLVSTDSTQEITDPGTSIQDMAILNADINIVRKSIKKLKKEHQDIIIWHYLEDMPITDIAKMIDKPAGTVRVMLHRGLKDLKEKVQES